MRSSVFRVIDSITENTDNYTWKEISCFYKPWAILFESFKPGYFNLFLFYLSFYDSFKVDGWFSDKYLEKYHGTLFYQFFEFSKNVLQSKFGVHFKTVEFSSEQEMHEKIRCEIDNGARILVPGDLFCIFYNVDDYKRTHRPHFFIIKGYDTEREIYFILDSVHINYGTDAAYKNFAMKFSDMYETNYYYFKDIVQNRYKQCFWSISNCDTMPDTDIPDVLLEHADILNLINKNEIEYEYVELQTIRNVELKGSNDDIREMSVKSNFKTVYYDLLFTYLRDADISEELISELGHYKDKVVECWGLIRNRIIYNVTKKERDFSKINRLIETGITNERVFRDRFVEIISESNLEKLKNIKSENEESMDFTEENNFRAAIIQEKDKIKIVHSPDKVYNLWVLQNDAPQMLLYAKQNTNFCFETKVSVNYAKGSYFQSGLILKLNDGTKYLFGNEEGKSVCVLCPEYDSDSLLFKKFFPINELYLKVEKQKDLYSFYYRLHGGSCWNLGYTLKSPASAKCFGLFSKTWEPMMLTVEFSNINYTES
ncbi:MAG: BtrH N-terminal domain-containing protein [Clostridia bacterium]|nr:BtrH N-terminal domain-containing protein [Clostridia bacterium]